MQLAGTDLKRHLVDDVDGGPGQAHAQPVHVDPDVSGRAPAGPAPSALTARSAPAGISSKVAVSALAVDADGDPGHGVGERVDADGEEGDQRRAGTMTAHGFNTSPMRFSLIMMPQFGAGGGWPNPRNDSPAMMTIE